MTTNKNILLIIANGPSCLKNKIGHKIDQFKEIGRINNYTTNNFEDFIGSKTSIWFNGANQGLKSRQNIPYKTIILVPYEVLCRKEKKLIEKIPKKLNLNNSKYTLIKKEKMKEYEDICNIKRPTTGLNSILWGIENYDKVIIHGFDFFENGKEHYYDSYLTKKIANLKIVGKGKKHDNEGEKLFVQGLVQEKKIVQLTEYLKES
tara:strand:+ start:5163 stop:5777 length:615 start_codon:yes stop_codon:yes gene_type:complete